VENHILVTVLRCETKRGSPLIKNLEERLESAQEKVHLDQIARCHPHSRLPLSLPSSSLC